MLLLQLQYRFLFIISGLEVILGILRENEHERFHPMLLHALAQFVYDDPSILKMIKNGLLDVLVVKLKEMALEGQDESTERYNPKKRGASSPPNRRAEIKFNRSDFGRLVKQAILWNWKE